MINETSEISKVMDGGNPNGGYLVVLKNTNHNFIKKDDFDKLSVDFQNKLRSFIK